MFPASTEMRRRCLPIISCVELFKHFDYSFSWVTDLKFQLEALCIIRRRRTRMATTYHQQLPLLIKAWSIANAFVLPAGYYSINLFATLQVSGEANTISRYFRSFTFNTIGVSVANQANYSIEHSFHSAIKILTPHRFMARAPSNRNPPFRSPQRLFAPRVWEVDSYSSLSLPCWSLQSEIRQMDSWCSAPTVLPIHNCWAF